MIVQIAAKLGNARMIQTTGVGDGKLFRTASPFDNQYGRASFVSEFFERNGVKTALNLTDDAQKLASYTDLPDYTSRMIESGNVVLCKIDANYRNEEFNRMLVQGLVELTNHPASYVVHCTEGKDRTGYACAILEALMGASYREIADDYLFTYYNYLPPKKQFTCL